MKLPQPSLFVEGFGELKTFKFTTKYKGQSIFVNIDEGAPQT